MAEETKVLVPEVLAKTQVEPRVELTLNKNDLVEMIVAEKEEELEAKLKAAKENAKQTHEAVEDALVKLSIAIGKYITADRKAEVALAEKLFSSKAQCTADRYNTHTIDGIEVRCEWTVLVEHKSEATGQWRYTKNLKASEISALPEFAVYKIAVKANEEANVVENQLDNDIATLSKMGVRAKAKMVREILKGSNEGQQLLAKLPNLSLLALPAPAEESSKKKSKR